MKFLTTELDDNGESKVDEEGIVIASVENITFDEALVLIREASSNEREAYRFKIIKDNRSIFFRFDNITTKIKDTPEIFIKNNWRF